MGRYLFIAAIAFVGGYTTGLFDGLAAVDQVAALTLGQIAPY